MLNKGNRKNHHVAERPHMPGYGIESSPKGLLPWRWAEKHLSTTKNYFLSTVRSDGRPHVMPIWGVWMDARFYFSTGRESVKARNLASNPNCVLCAGEADEAVILEGRVARIRNKSMLEEIAATYFRKYKIDVTGMNEPWFGIRPQVVFGQIEKTFVKSATRWRFSPGRKKL
jgi:pyridoxine/pyridoxamine 5'-phosphate oxidase